MLTVSDFSKREIVRCFGIDPAKIEVVYSGATELAGIASPGGSDDPRPRPDLARRRIRSVLFVGSIFARRHVPELIEGFARLARRRPDVSLEIVGDNRSRPAIDLAALVAGRGRGRPRPHPRVT